MPDNQGQQRQDDQGDQRHQIRSGIASVRGARLAELNVKDARNEGLVILAGIWGQFLLLKETGAREHFLASSWMR